MTWWGRGVGMTVVGLALVVVTGCSSSDTPGVLDTSPPSPPSSASPSAEPTSSSPSASATSTLTADEQTVVDAIHNYYSSFVTALITGDTSGLVAATTSSCECNAVEKMIRDTYAKGHSYADASVDITSVTGITGPNNDGSFSANVVYDATAYREVNGSGRTVDTFDAFTNRLLFFLVPQGGRLLIGRIEDQG